MIVRLERFGRDVDATWGRMFVEGIDGPLFTVERPLQHNRRNESCIPAGTYALVPHVSQRFGDVWALTGDGVSRWKDDNVSRFGILIHAANYARQVEGCIALGTGLSNVLGEMGVAHSRDACKLLDEVLKRYERPAIEITWAS